MKKFLSVILMAAVVALLSLPLAGCSSSQIDTVLADLPIAADIAISVVNIVSPGNAEYVQEVTEYAGKVSADLKLLESIISQYKNRIGAQPGAVHPGESTTHGAPHGQPGQAGSSTAVPATVFGQINAVVNDAQSNLSAIMKAVNVSDPKVTAAVAAAIAAVKLILSDVALLVKNSAPPAVTAQLFFGVGMPVEVIGYREQGTEKTAVQSQKPSGKSARQIAKEYNQKICKDFPKAKVNVPKLHLLGAPVPMTGK